MLNIHEWSIINHNIHRKTPVKIAFCQSCPRLSHNEGNRVVFCMASKQTYLFIAGCARMYVHVWLGFIIVMSGGRRVGEFSFYFATCPIQSSSGGEIFEHLSQRPFNHTEPRTSNKKTRLFFCLEAHSNHQRVCTRLALFIWPFSWKKRFTFRALKKKR